MEKILTIIIPTYNMEKYLRRCLDSLIVDAEKMAQLEVLVVNDGSKDSSSAIAHEYAAKYPQTFRVIDKENGNYGSCVNRGLKEANGKYVKILDADDYFDNYSFCLFLQNLSTIDVDLILTDFKTVDITGGIIEISNYKKLDIIAYRTLDIQWLIHDCDVFFGQMHAFTYRLKILRNMKYCQTEGCSYTDQEWVFMPITRVSNFYYQPIVLYQYLLGREGQTMQTILDKSISQLMQVVLSMSCFFETGTYNRVIFTQYLRRQLAIQLGKIYSACLLQKQFKLSLLQNFDRELSRYHNSYQICKQFRLIGLSFVAIWREHQMQIPWYLSIVIYLYHIRQIIQTKLLKG